MSAKRLLPGLRIVVLLLLALASGCATDDQQPIADILDQARAATEAQSSYRFDISFTDTMDTVGEIGSAQGDGAFVVPDRLRVRLVSDESETIGLTIGSVSYARSFPFTPQRPPLSGIIMSAMTADSLSLGHSLATHFLDTLDSRVQRLPDDSIDGEATWHFRLLGTTIDQKLVRNPPSTSCVRKARRPSFERSGLGRATTSCASRASPLRGISSIPQPRHGGILMALAR